MAYPDTFDGLTTGHVAGETIRSADVNAIADAVNRLQQALGLDPAGNATTVADRLLRSLRKNVVVDYSAPVYLTAAAAAAGTSARSAIQTAIDEVAALGAGSIKSVYVPSGYYRLDTNLSLPNGVELVGDGDSTVFVCDDVTNGGVGAIKIEGSIASTKSLAANVASGERVVQVTASGFAVGDWLVLRDTQGFGTVSDTNTEHFVRVHEFAAGAPDSIYLEEEVVTPVGYLTANTAQALKISPVVGASVRNLCLQVPTIGAAVNRSCAVQARYTVDCEVENVTVRGFVGKSSGSGGAPPVSGYRSRGLRIHNVHGDRCSDNRLAVAPDDHNCRTINVDSCTHARVEECELTRCGGSGAISFQQNAYLHVTDNVIGGHIFASDQALTGSRAGDQGGRGIKLLYGNVHFTCDDNIVHGAAYNGIRVDDSCFGTVNDNVIYDSGDQGILILGSKAAAPWTSCIGVTCQGNGVRKIRRTATSGIALDRVSECDVIANKVRELAGGGSAGAISVSNAERCNVQSNRTDSGDYGIKLGTNATKNLVSGNIITGCTVKSIDSSLSAGLNKVYGNVLPTGSTGAVNLHASDTQTLDTPANSNWQV